MITVKTIDLFNLATDMLDQGFPFTTIDVLEPDPNDDFQGSVSFECPVDESEVVEYEPIDHEVLPKDFNMNDYPLTTNFKSYCMLPFTLEELTILYNGMKNAVQLLLDNLSETSLPAEERSECSKMLKLYEPLIAKIEEHFRSIGFEY